jgi:uncharacterized protein
LKLLTEPLYLTLFLTGFTVGFGHCIGMCGPIIVSLSLSLKERTTLVPHLFYHLGRITTYAILGGVLGALGSFTFVIARVASLQKGAMLLGGIVIILMGLGMTGRIPFFQGLTSDRLTPQGLLSRALRRVSGTETALAYLPLGALFGLLPCGPVYTSLIAAARAGMEGGAVVHGVFRGVGLMLAFGMGTMPALFLVATLSSLGWVKSRERIYSAGALLMVALGIYFVVKALRY